MLTVTVTIMSGKVIDILSCRAKLLFSFQIHYLRHSHNLHCAVIKQKLRGGNWAVLAPVQLVRSDVGSLEPLTGLGGTFVTMPCELTLSFSMQY